MHPRRQLAQALGATFAFVVSVVSDQDRLSLAQQQRRQTLRRSKTDQEGQGRRIGIPYGASELTCPVRSLQAWLEAAGNTSGPIFRPVDCFNRVQDQRLSDKAVARTVKRSVAAVKDADGNAALDPTRYAGHSLRAGLATSAAAAGVEERKIMAQTGHRSTEMVRRYIREGLLFDNAAARVGL